MALSPKQRFLELPKHKQHAFIDSLTEGEAQALLRSWDGWEARPNQLPPEGDWFTWILMFGRGGGKTKAASEYVISEVIKGDRNRIGVVGRTAADVRDVMVTGQSGLLAVARLRGIQAHHEPSKRLITFSNGVTITTYSAESGDALRGPEHSLVWADELAAWPKGKGDSDAFTNLLFGLRLGDPKLIVSTTPRPSQRMRELVSDPRTVVSRGSTYDNADNLAPSFLLEIERRYKGTRLGRQEIEGDLIENVEGALWTYATIADARVEEAPRLQRIVVAIDPAVTANASSDYTGLGVVGLGFDNEFYVLHSEHVKASPHAWAKRAIDLYDEYNADRIVAERNNGGEMVEATIRNLNPNVPVKTIHASRGKQTRAEPVAALYEQSKVHHVGEHKELEDEMIVFPIATDVNDDLVDSLVYAITELNPHDSKAGQLIVFKK
ncbi:MAG: terminase family protein [Thermomicrobiales bacterium]